VAELNLILCLGTCEGYGPLCKGKDEVLQYLVPVLYQQAGLQDSIYCMYSIPKFVIVGSLVPPPRSSLITCSKIRCMDQFVSLPFLQVY
jgi:hypothetical protein